MPPLPGRRARVRQRQNQNQANAMFQYQRNRSLALPPPALPAPTDPGVPGSQPAGPPPAPGTYGIRVGGQEPVVPTEYNAWLWRQPEYQRADASRDTSRASQLGSLSQAIAASLGLYGGASQTSRTGFGGTGSTTMTTANIDAIRDAVVGELNKTDAGKALLGSLDWSQIQNMANQSTEGGVSTVAQLERANRDAQSQIQNSALSRGIIGSGLAGHDTQQQNEAYTRAQFDAQNQLMQYLTGLSTAFAQGETERQSAFEASIGGIAPPEWAGQAGMEGPVGAGAPTGPAPTPDAPPGSSGGGDGGGAARARQRRAAAAAAAARARARARARRAA